MEPIENPLFPLDLSIFHEHVKMSLGNILEKLDDKLKSIVVSSLTLKILNFFVDINFLETKKCARQIVVLAKVNLLVNSDIIVYVIPPLLSCLEAIAFQITTHKKSNINKKYAIIFVSKINYDCKSFIDAQEVFRTCDYEIFNLPIDIYPLDYDILSLEENEYDYIQSQKSLPNLVRALVKIETVFGKIKNKYLKGDNAVELNKLFTKEENIFESDNEILAGVFIDRSVDFVTPMCSVNTYEGLIDEFIGINFNSLKKPSILEKEANKDFSSKNTFYEKIRDSNFNEVRNFLPVKLRTIIDTMKEAKESTETDMKKISEGLEKVKLAQIEFQPCKTHINIATHIREYVDHPSYIESLRKEQPMLSGKLPENIYDYYDMSIAQQKNFYSVIKLMCLENIIFGGLKPKMYDQLKRDICLSFGHQEIFLLKNLEKLKLLRKLDSKVKSQWDSLKSNLNLLNINVNTTTPDDAAYVFNAFCPITIRLIEAVTKKGWSIIKDELKKLPGAFDYPLSERNILKPIKNKINFILLVFIGGITYAEIAAIRYLNKTQKEYKYFILTTHITSGKKIIDNLKLNVDNNVMTMKDFHSQLKNIK